VLHVGGGDKGGSKMEVLLLAVPRFSATHSCVSVNLRTLECQEIKIDAAFGAALETDDKQEAAEEEEVMDM